MKVKGLEDRKYSGGLSAGCEPLEDVVCEERRGEGEDDDPHAELIQEGEDDEQDDRDEEETEHHPPRHGLKEHDEDAQGQQEHGERDAPRDGQVREEGHPPSIWRGVP